MDYEHTNGDILNDGLIEYEYPYTKEQKRHLDLLEERIREVEQQLFSKVANISRHLQAALDDGMRDYDTFVVDGLILIEPSDIPKYVEKKFLNLFPYSAICANEGNVEDDLKFYKELADNYDWRYIAHPEEYHADYKPICRAYDYIIVYGMVRNLFTIDDLMLIKPEDIYPHIEIHI